jgi:hypothetical protein
MITAHGGIRQTTDTLTAAIRLILLRHAKAGLDQIGIDLCRIMVIFTNMFMIYQQMLA